jgi:hypothetical protein
MQKREHKPHAKSMTVEEFRKFRKNGPPDKGGENFLDHCFTEFSHMIGLTRQARERIARRLREETVGDRIGTLHGLMNIVTDGGLRGFVAALRVCLVPLPR